jgi:ATP-dependent exoDNAse (exonuclease V) alpha subunit
MDLSMNNESEHLHVVEKVDEDHYKVGLPLLNYFTTKQEQSAISWIYPNGEFDPNVALNSVILASTNNSVDDWNAKIQNMNKNKIKTYESRDQFNEVDDEKGILASILTDEVMNRYNRNGVPTHILSFKVDDICIILRAIPQLSLATNTRVQIVRLLRNGVRIKTLNEPTQRYVNLQRINFKFRLEYGESYQMTRIQLPLRLAYSMTYNKSQSQTLEKVLVDCTGEPFAHGHSYVSFSRVRNNDKISAYVDEQQLHPVGDSSGRMMPVISNIVYKNILI